MKIETQSPMHIEGLNGADPITYIGTRLNSARSQLSALECEIRRMAFIKVVLEGLDHSQKHYSGGDLEPGYYFASQETGGRIIPSSTIELHKECPGCNNPHPVIVKYIKNRDSWELRAFVMCDTGFHQLAHYGEIKPGIKRPSK